VILGLRALPPPVADGLPGLASLFAGWGGAACAAWLAWGAGLPGGWVAAGCIASPCGACETCPLHPGRADSVAGVEL